VWQNIAFCTDFLCWCLYSVLVGVDEADGSERGVSSKTPKERKEGAGPERKGEG
jgi:hypothetical protein